MGLPVADALSFAYVHQHSRLARQRRHGLDVSSWPHSRGSVLGDHFDGAEFPSWFSHLLREWRARQSRRAHGGALALAGFHYQFVVVLRSTVDRWLELPAEKKADPVVFTEVLSDALEISDGGRVVVAQVKRTQTTTQIRHALEELWDIWVLAGEVAPQERDRLTFRIVSAATVVRDVDALLTTWLPSGDYQSESQLDQFRSRVTIHVEPFPETELLALLTNRLRCEDPLAFVRQSVGRLLEAAVDSAAFVSAAREIWRDLFAAQRQGEPTPASPFYLWSHVDQAPSSIESGDYLIGERPMPRHLRLGYFAERRSMLDALMDSLQTWMWPHPAGKDRSQRLPVFWIGGPSGTGKSIALLQTLARLNADGVGPIVWLGGSSTFLADAIRHARRLRYPNQVSIVALDDPYAPASSEPCRSPFPQGACGVDRQPTVGPFVPEFFARLRETPLLLAPPAGLATIRPRPADSRAPSHRSRGRLPPRSHPRTHRPPLSPGHPSRLLILNPAAPRPGVNSTQRCPRTGSRTRAACGPQRLGPRAAAPLARRSEDRSVAMVWRQRPEPPVPAAPPSLAASPGTGDYKYGVRASIAGTNQALSDDDPHLLVRP